MSLTVLHVKPFNKWSRILKDSTIPCAVFELHYVTCPEQEQSAVLLAIWAMSRLFDQSNYGE